MPEQIAFRRIEADMEPVPLFTQAQYVVETIGIIAFALAGIVQAARQKLDAIGVCAVAGLTAFGGGTLRDLLLDRRPFFWVENPELLWLIFALAILSISFMRTRHMALTQRAVLIPDAVGLGLFCATGTQLAIAMEMPPLIAVLMGVISAIFGSVLRDIVCNEIPQVFADHQPYALCAFLGGWVLIGLTWMQLPGWFALVGAATFAALLRLLALWFDWRIPQWRME